MKCLRLSQVTERTTLCKQTIRDLRRSGEFPEPIRLRQKRIAWVESDIDTWLEERAKESGWVAWGERVAG